MRFFRAVPRVSPALREDAAALAGLLGVEAGDVAAWLGGGFEVYKATLEGRLVGCVRCAFPTGACVVDMLAVAPDHRRRGFGQYLAEHAISRARRAGAARIWTQVGPGDASARSLLAKLGFREPAPGPAPAGGIVLLELAL